MIEPLISIIVPVYKVEPYLERCLNSVINQTYRNIQIILVDDGSPDQCGNICDKYAQEDDRIVVIHRMNGGLSAARNTGLQAATGEFIAYIDSDDFVDVEMIETLYKYIVQYRCDIAVCSYQIFSSEAENMVNKEKENQTIVVQSREAVYENLGTANPYRWYEPQVWNKLYRAELIKDIRFEEGKYCEDQFYCHLAYENVERVVFTSEKLYFYMNRGNSISGTFSPRMLDAIEGMENRIIFAQEKKLAVLENNTCAAMLDLLMRYWYESYKMKDYKMTKLIHKRFCFYIVSCNVNARSYSKEKLMKYKLFCKFPLLCKKILSFIDRK